MTVARKIAGRLERPRRAVRIAPAMRTALLAAAVSAACWAPSESQEFEWTTYLNPNHPIDLTVSGGKVWVVSKSGGVLVYDIADATFSTIHKRPGGLSSNNLLRTLTDSRGRIWFGSLSEGLDVLEVDTSNWRAITSFDGLPSDTVTVIADWGDSLWVGTPSGFAVFDDRTLAGRCNVNLPPDVRCPLDSHVILAIAPVDSGAYVGTGAGVVWFDGDSVVRLGDPWTQGIVVDMAVHDGAPWVITPLGGFRWDSGQSQWIQTAGLPPFGGLLRLSVIDGVLYAATTSGVFRWSGTSWSMVGNGFYANAVAGSEADGLWAAGAVGFYRLADGQWTQVLAPGPAFNDSRSVAVGGGDEVWFTGPDWAVNRFDGEEWETLDPTTTENRLQGCDVYGVLVDSSSRVWFGHCCLLSAPDSCLADRLARSPGSWRWRRFETPNIWRVAEGGGALWLAGRYTGLYRIGEGEGEPENIQPGTGLSSLSLSSLAYDPANGLWIGHRQSGVDLFRGGDPNNPANWSHLGDDDGILSDNVRDVLVLDDRLWVGTLGGVSVVDPFTMKVVRNYTIGPGGIDDRISSVSGLAVDGLGNVWVSTVGNGVFVIRRDESVLSFKTRNSPLTDDKAADVAYAPGSDAVWIATFEGINRVIETGSQEAGAGADLYVYPNPYCPDGCNGSEGGPLRIGGVPGALSGEVVDLKGQIVARFFDAQPGDPIWNGLDVSGSPAGSGLYFVIARSGSGAHRAKFAVVR